MKSGLFLTYLSELMAHGHYSLVAGIELPWNGNEVRVPLRFSAMSRIEFQRGISHEVQMSENHLLNLMKLVTEQHAVIRQTTGERLFFCASIQGELGFNGSGRDVELARHGNPHANGLYFDVSRLVVPNDRDMLFRHRDSPISETSGLGSHITASYEKVTSWLREQHGLTVS